MMPEVKNLLASFRDIRDMGSIPGSGRSPRGGHGSPLQCSCLENPWTEEPGGLQSMGSHRVGHDGSDLAHKHKCPTHRPRNTGQSRGDERQAAQTADKVRSSDLRGRGVS